MLILLKRKRKAFIIPCIIITVIVLNPVFYNKWNAINGYGYWRTLWLLPIIPVCAAVPAVFIEKVKKNWINPIILFVFAGLFICSGSFIYSHDYTSFSKAGNGEKLPDKAIMVADALLELSDEPSVVADDDICIFLRQYSGKIRSMYARDIYWGTAAAKAQNVRDQLTKDGGDLGEVALTMLNYDYEFLVMKGDISKREEALAEAGFEPVKQVGQYWIFRVNGNPTEIRTYNERHQVTALTYVDENGNPQNNAQGVATVTYEYDKNDRVYRKLYFDASGKAATDDSGKAGVEREYNRRNQIIKEIWLNEAGKPLIAGGYAMRTMTYIGEDWLASEKYFDEYGNPMIREDTLYSERRLSYDENGNIVSEKYYDLNGQLTMSSAGYAGYERVYDENSRCISETYLNTEEKPVETEAGYCSLEKEYDESGNVITERYLDENGRKVVCTKGYACVRREYNDNGKIIHEWYEDESGKGVCISKGFAGFYREYDERGNVLVEKYLDAEGNETRGEKGYSKICRIYDQYNRVVKESYFRDEAPYTVKGGYSALIRFYNSEGELYEEHYFDAEGNPVITGRGYSIIRYTYNENGKIQEEVYLDAEGNPVVIGAGFSKCKYTYTEDGLLSLKYFEDLNDKAVETGSGYLHDYLESLLNSDVSLIMAVKDDGSQQMTVTLYEDMEKFGIKTDLRGQYRKSFYSVVTPDGVVEELADTEIKTEGKIGDVSYSVASAGYLVGNTCSIMINDVEYAVNSRGLNIVVIDNEEKKVIDSVCFDTCGWDIKVTR